MNDGYREVSAKDWSEDSVRLIVTPSLAAQSSLYYVQEIGHFQARPTYFTEREKLESYLVVYTLFGEGTLTYGEHTYSLRPGDVFYIHCMEYQRYSSTGDGWELLWVHLNGPSAKTYYEWFASSGTPVLPLQPESPIPALMNELLQLQLNRDYRTELVGSKLLTDLLTTLALAAQERDRPPLEERPSYTREMARLLDREYRERWTLDRLAKRFNVSKYHLAKEFKRYTGFSPVDYLINVRISRAEEKLKYSEQPVAEIAGSVGVEHVTHFINLFKERTGLTPLAYRRSWQKR